MTRTLSVIDPATGDVTGTYPETAPEELDAVVERADAAQLLWRETPLQERAAVLRAAAGLLRRDKTGLARLVTSEMGKPVAEAEAEVEKCALGCEFYAEHGPGFLDDREVVTAARLSYVRYAPMGVVLAIMPWNYPMWQAWRFLAPALMAGNGAVLKHAPNVSGCALAIERICVEAGLPVGLLGVVLVSDAAVEDAVERLICHPKVRAVTLTGSERAGASVAAVAGRALKKTVLELGGSDPFIVLADADIPAVVDFAVTARFGNAGQSCISAKRFLVASAVAEQFTQQFAVAVGKLAVGPPLEPGTDIGPLARADLLVALERQVDTSTAAGATVLVGGHRLPGQGSFFAPTVLTDVRPGMAAFDEETFGPVAAVTVFHDEDQAVQLANATRYGLGASIWTRDPHRAQRLGDRIQSGALFVNGVVASDPRLPFGGTKSSGYGRELSAEGLHEFTEVRTFWVGPSELAAQTPDPLAVSE